MIPGAIVGKYRLYRQLGRGAMGEVWAGVNTDTDREVALKLITSPDPELRRRLLREARAMGRLDHPNIVQILDRGETAQGEPFLVMPLLQGETLGDRLHRERTLPETIAAGIALDIARALRAAHEKEIIHRDLKPANIFLHREPDTDEDVVKVVDFGVSQLSIENEGGATVQGSILGSPAYMSPEQVRSSGVDGRSDIWGLGVMLFEMLAGERPLNGTSSVVVLTQILDTQPVRRLETVAPRVKRGLCDLVATCLERDPARRVPSAAELARLLRPFATRGRHATVEGPADRVAAPPEPPRPEPARGLPVLAEDDDAAEDKVSTEVYRPSMLLSAAIASAQAPGTGTMLMPAPARRAAPAPPRESTTTMWHPGMKPPVQDPPTVDESERPTHEMIAAPAPRPAPPAPAPVVAAPAPRPPPIPPPPDYGSGAWPRPPAAPTASPASGSWPKPPVAPPVAPGSGSWPAVQQVLGAPVPPPPTSQPRQPSAPDLSHLSPAERKKIYARTQPLDPVVFPPPPPQPSQPELDLRGGTMKVDPRLIPRSPAAGGNRIPPPNPVLVTTHAPMESPAAPPGLVSPEPEHPRRWPFVLLGASIVALVAVVAMLVVTLRDEPGAQVAPAQASGAPEASTSATTAPLGAPPTASAVTPLPSASASATASAPPAKPPRAAPSATFRPQPNPPF
jgi:serine/threonine-protein kinase